MSDGNADDISASSIEAVPHVNSDAVPEVIKKQLNLPSNLVEIEQGVALKGISLTYSNGDICENGEQASFTINLYCNDTMALDELAYNGLVRGGDCNPQVDMVSGAACARLSVSQLWEYLDDYAEYFGAFAIVAGVLLVFAGRKMLKPALFFAGFISSILLSFLLFYTVYLDKTSQIEDFWFFLGGGALVGIAVGLLLACFTKLGAAVLAGWGGFCAGLILNESIFFRAQ